MKITKEKQFVSITPSQKADFTSLLAEINNKITEFSDDNIILNLSEITLKIDDLIQFKNISEQKMDLGTSFVIVYSEIDLDLLPDELVVVPTYQEAIDMIDMDEMTRSLDF